MSELREKIGEKSLKPDTGKRDDVQQEIVDITQVEKEASPEARKKVEQTIRQTLEMDENAALDNFPEKLTAAVEKLPRYQEMKARLDGVSPDKLGYALFQEIKRNNDKPIKDESVPEDGVLVSSMRQGKLECAGRVLLASTYLQERGLDHAVGSAPGHSFLLLERNDNTLDYCDLNNNLFFSFPREALSGYEGQGKTSECWLGEYQPREGDTVDGLNTPFTHFVTIPPQEGMARQYLENVKAALNGNKEFVKSNISPSKEASEAMAIMSRKMLGQPDEKLARFMDNSEANIKAVERQSQADRKLIGEILSQHPEKEDFAQIFAQVVEGDLGSRLVYLRNAPETNRINFGKKVWDFLQKPEMDEDISRMQ